MALASLENVEVSGSSVKCAATKGETERKEAEDHHEQADKRRYTNMSPVPKSELPAIVIMRTNLEQALAVAHGRIARRARSRLALPHPE